VVFKGPVFKVRLVSSGKSSRCVSKKENENRFCTPRINRTDTTIKDNFVFTVLDVFISLYSWLKKTKTTAFRKDSSIIVTGSEYPSISEVRWLSFVYGICWVRRGRSGSGSLCWEKSEAWRLSVAELCLSVRPFLLYLPRPLHFRPENPSALFTPFIEFVGTCVESEFGTS